MKQLKTKSHFLKEQSKNLNITAMLEFILNPLARHNSGNLVNCMLVVDLDVIIVQLCCIDLNLIK